MGQPHSIRPANSTTGVFSTISYAKHKEPQQSELFIELPAPSPTCRPDQLFGLWSVEPVAFSFLVEMAKGADLQALRAAPALPEPPPYMVDGSGVAHMDISGPMTKRPTSFQSITGGTSTLKARQALQEAVRDPTVRSIMLRVESPGGTMVGTQELADAVRVADSKKPVYAFVEDVGASAAYWVAAQARYIYANAAAQVGSIGTFAVLKDTSGAYQQAGVKVHVVASTGATAKGVGTPGTEITPEVLEEAQQTVDAANQFFLKGVSQGRRMPMGEVQKLADGRMHFAQEAKALGLIDSVASFDDAITEVRGVMEKNEVMELQASLKASEDAKAELQQKVEHYQGMVADVEALKAANETLVAEKRSQRFKAEAETIGVPDAFASVLDIIESKCGAETYNAVATQLKANAAQEKAAALFSEAGTSTVPAGGSAGQQIEAIAQQMVKEGKAANVNAAMSMAIKSNKELAAKHLQEQRKGRQ